MVREQRRTARSRRRGVSASPRASICYGGLLLGTIPTCRGDERVDVLLNTQELLDRFAQPDWRVAIPAALVVAIAAFAARALSVSGAIAAFAVGCIAMGLGGGKFIVPLLAFFITS